MPIEKKRAPVTRMNIARKTARSTNPPENNVKEQPSVSAPAEKETQNPTQSFLIKLIQGIYLFFWDLGFTNRRGSCVLSRKKKKNGEKKQ